MSEMIERVALAISGSDDPANILAIHRHRARAAIEAMRILPKPIVSNAANNLNMFDHEIERIWDALIDNLAA